MKKVLIMFMIVMLIVAGCASDEPISIEPETSGVVENNIIEEGAEETVYEGSEYEVSEVLEDEKSDDVTEESATTEELPAQEPAKTEDPAKTEEPVTTDEPDIDQEPVESEVEDTGKLKVQGLVEHELLLSLNDLKSMSNIIFEADFYSLNSYGTTGYTHFKGVKLWDLLETKAMIKPEATNITIRAEDGYSMIFTIDQVKMEYMDETTDNKYPMIVAWEENGEEYSTDEGAPYKLVVGQKEPGDVNKPQWVSNIDVILVE